MCPMKSTDFDSDTECPTRGSENAGDVARSPNVGLYAFGAGFLTPRPALGKSKRPDKENFGAWISICKIFRKKKKNDMSIGSGAKGNA